MEKFIKIYYSLLHSDLAHSSQWIYSFLITAFESNEPLSYSISELSKELEYDKKTISNGLKELEDNGYIQIIKEKGKKNKFSLVREKYNEIVNMTYVEWKEQMNEIIKEMREKGYDEERINQYIDNFNGIEVLFRDEDFKEEEIISAYDLIDRVFNSKDKTIEWAKRETDEALKQFKDYYNLTNDSLLNKIKR